ncbi:Pectin lyase fold, partial [Cynara cardunculus var. scolymus]
MGFLIIFVLSLCYILFGLRTTSAANFYVTSYGAKGDGNTDDSKAFLKAWADVCKDKSQDPTLIIPSGKTFLLSPMTLSGPCNFPRVHI